MLTIEQRETRRQYIGSSDAPAILGVDPYRSASDVYLEKTGQVDDFEGNDATERGNLLEPVLIGWAQEKLGEHFSPNILQVADDGLLCCNFDAIRPGQSIEAKTATNADEWGDEGTDEIPERHIIQIHHGFAVVPTLRVCWVPVLLPGYRSLDFRLYRVERNEVLADAVANGCRQFMELHVKLGIPPSDFKPSIEVLKRMRREPNKIVAIGSEIADRLVAARAACKQAEDEKHEAERAMLAAMGDAEGADPGDGRTITYMQTNRKGYVVKDTTYRTLRIKSAKGTK